MTSVFSTPINPPGNFRDACGKWGCGTNGDCINNICVCRDFWAGDHCQIPPPIPPSTPKACSNWGVKLTPPTQGAPGRAATCDCGYTGMQGARCEIECSMDSECGSGTCDLTVGRCVCTPEWGDVQCRRALTASCATNADCGVGTCVSGGCVCPANHTGLRCEFGLRNTDSTCRATADCLGAGDVCETVFSAADRACATRRNGCQTEFTGQACKSTGEACTADVDCATTCMDGVCRRDPTIYPPPSSGGLCNMGFKQSFCDNNIAAVIDQILTPEGLAGLALEEALEEVAGYSFRYTKLALTATASRLRAQMLKTASGKAAARVSSRMVSRMVARTGLNAMRKAIIRTAVTKLATTAATGVGALYAMVEIVGLAMDINDSSGYNAALPQSFITQYMRDISSALNAELAEIGVSLPREFTPDDTIGWRAYFASDPVQLQTLKLASTYLDALVINSNGERITAPVAAATPPKPPARNPVLWALVKNEDVYDNVKKWWWLGLMMLILLAMNVVIILIVNK